MTSIDVCIVAYDNAATIEQCITSLSVIGSGVSVALADNHPGQTTVDAAQVAAARAGIPIRVIDRPDNPGFAVSCNALASESGQDWLLFLNPDASIRSWPGNAAMGGGITAPRIYGSDGRRQHSYGRRRSMLNEVSRRLQIRPREPKGTGYVSGAAFVIARQEFLDVGGFDDRYFMYYEDIDLCRTVVESGGTVRIEPTFVVEHIGGYSAAKVPASTALRSYASARQFHRKWSGTTLWIDLLVLVDSAARVAAARLGCRVPGAEGARATVSEARLRLSGRFRRRSRR